MTRNGAMRVLRAGRQKLRGSVLSTLAAVALIAVIGMLGVVTYWHHRVDTENTADVLEARRMSALYTQANDAARRAELLISVGNATGDPQYLAQQAEVQVEINETFGAISNSPGREDRRFGDWANLYIMPIVELFARLREDPSPPFEELVAQYGVDYAALYASVKAGDLGDPGLAGYLVDPEAVDGDPARLPNPMTIITRIKAEERAAAADATLAATESKEEVALLVTQILYGVGVFLVLGLVVATIRFGRSEARTVAENDQLRRISTTDPLTGLGNRRAFEEAIERVGASTAGGAAALVMMDLDEFKIVNDTFGHGRGDAVLSKFAGLLSKLAPPGVSRFRIGGDEFALIVHGTESAEAFYLAERVRLQAMEFMGNEVTVSAGVAVLDLVDRDVALLAQRADAALYEAKLRGRNLTMLYHQSEGSVPVFPAAKLQAVRLLLQEGRIDPVFQPIWQLHSRALLGYEGLSRPHPDYDLDGPQQAFDIAEQFGHAAELDALCRHHLLDAAKELPAEGLLFINISPYTLTHQSFSPMTLLRELKAANVSRSRVVFEVTERSSVPIDVISEAVAELRSHGFAVALDDVGSGHNGLELMSKAAFDYVKIDRSVMLSATKGASSRAALMAILAFATESGAVVIAEGIEDEAMFDLVRDVAASTQLRGNPGLIHGVQGFLFGLPLPAEEATTASPPELAA
jgi:diguanylate cyclase (GGDEF)-like protein